MRVFKQRYRDRRTGGYAKTEGWYVGIIVDGVERRIPAFTDKRASEELGRRCQDLANMRVAGGRPDAAQLAWIEQQPQRMRDRLARIGVLDSRGVASAKPLRDHLDDYRQALLDRGRTANHANLTKQRILAILNGTGAVHISDVKPAAVERYLASRREHGLSPRSSNAYLIAAKAFCGWLVTERRTSENPVGHLSKLNEQADKRRIRRALEPDVLLNLLTTTHNGPTRFRISGPNRCWLYRFAAETGFRASEIRSLTPASFVLDGPEPTATVQAAYSKRRSADVQPLRPDTAVELREYFSGKLPGAPAFPMPHPCSVARMLKADLEAAGIAYTDDAGRTFDFHSLRHQFASNLAASKVHPKTAQELMRHSTIGLTMNVYTHSLHGDLASALDALPDLSRPTRETARATGTDNTRVNVPACLPSSLPSTHARRCKTVHGDAVPADGQDANRTQAGVDKTAITGREGDWVEPELNRRHTDFQSVALPTELPTRWCLTKCAHIMRGGSQACKEKGQVEIVRGS